jgi:hypothetical protein
MRAKAFALAAVALGVSALAAPSPLRAEHPAIARAERAIAAGKVVPSRDIAPLLSALRRASTVEEKRELVDAIADLGETDGNSPNAVKSYLVAEAPPVLLEVAKNGHDPFLQGDALAALRGMDVPRSVLEEGAAIAEADPDAFVRSRGEILRNFIAGLPEEDETTTHRPVESAAAKAAIAQLDELGVGVSTESLRTAARDGNAEIVAALLAAGVAPDTGVRDLHETPLYLATFIGCSTQGEETDWLVETVRHLVDAGADLTIEDDNHNTVLISAAQMCGPRIVTALVDGGAKVGARNGSGLTPLGIALVHQKLDVAEALVKKGARLTREERAMVEPGMTDARGKALIKRASGGS